MTNESIVKMCARTVRFFDNIISSIVVLFFLFCLLIGTYFVVDAAYVFYNASGEKIAAYRPHLENGEINTADHPFTDDYVGWIYIPDSGIDYPIMQGDTNQTYLNTNPYGEYSLAGSIFLDYRASSDFSDQYSMVYGHHMSGGYMFGCLDKYYSEEYFESHREGVLTVGNKDYTVTAFAVMLTDANVSAVFNPKPNDDVIAYAMETAVFYRDDVDGRILALSTCNDPSNTSRTVVLFRISEVVRYAGMQKNPELSYGGSNAARTQPEHSLLREQ